MLALTDSRDDIWFSARKGVAWPVTFSVFHDIKEILSPLKFYESKELFSLPRRSHSG